MARIEFNDYKYYPALCATKHEHEAYRMLSAADKTKMCPIFELSHRRDANNLGFAVTMVKECVESRPFILDLNKMPAPAPYRPKKPKDPVASKKTYEKQLKAQLSYNSSLRQLLDSKEGFKNWRGLVSQFPNAVPTLAFHNLIKEEKEILAQAAAFAKEGRSFAIRIGSHDDPHATKIISQIYSSLTAPLLLVIIDCYQGRIFLKKRAAFASGTMSAVKAGVPLEKQHLLRALSLSNSYIEPGKGKMKAYKNLDGRLHNLINERFAFLYGDYGLNYRISPKDTYVPAEWVARVVYPIKDGWIGIRDDNQNDPSGWVKCAKEIVASDDFKSKQQPNTWGVRVIRQAAKGDLTGIQSVEKWRAVRINVHLHRQTNSVP